MTGFFPDDIFALGKFGFIVFDDVFEYLPDPKAALTWCEALLALEGVLNLPSNHGLICRLASLLARNGQLAYLERLWKKDFPFLHLSYFNPAVLQRFVDRYSRLRHIDTFFS